MAEPNGAQRLVGRAGDRILSGSNNYDPVTGKWSNVGPGLIGFGARLIGTFLGGPAVGAAVGRVANWAVDKYGNRIGPVQAEGISPYAPLSVNGVNQPMGTPQVTPNLGLGAQTPGNAWSGYLQGQGAANNFGNTQFGNGMAGIPSSWAPQSTWGQSVAANQGSNINFGNYSPGAVATGAVRGGGGGSGGVNSGARGGIGGNSVGDAGGARSAFWKKTTSLI